VGLTLAIDAVHRRCVTDGLEGLGFRFVAFLLRERAGGMVTVGAFLGDSHQEERHLNDVPQGIFDGPAEPVVRGEAVLLVGLPDRAEHVHPFVRSGLRLCRQALHQQQGVRPDGRGREQRPDLIEVRAHVCAVHLPQRRPVLQDVARHHVQRRLHEMIHENHQRGDFEDQHQCRFHQGSFDVRGRETGRRACPPGAEQASLPDTFCSSAQTGITCSRKAQLLLSAGSAGDRPNA